MLDKLKLRHTKQKQLMDIFQKGQGHESPGDTEGLPRFKETWDEGTKGSISLTTEEIQVGHLL